MQFCLKQHCRSILTPVTHELTMSLVRVCQQFDTWCLTPIALGYEIPLQHRALQNDPREEEVKAMTMAETSIYILLWE